MSPKGSVEALITLSTKHLGPGSICPPMGIGTLRCYSMLYCPYAQRTRLVLLAKNIKHEMVNVNLRTKPDWLFEKNPLGKVPVLEKDGQVLYESLITCDYLEDMYPDPPLYPADPWQKAQDKLLIDRFTMVTNPYFKILFGAGDTELVAKGVEQLCEGLGLYEAELKKRGTKFFGSEKPGMLDYMIWPWVERFAVSQEVVGDNKFFTEEKFPAMLSWSESMMSDPAVTETVLPLDAHIYFLTTFDGKTREIKRKEASKL